MDKVWATVGVVQGVIIPWNGGNISAKFMWRHLCQDLKQQDNQLVLKQYYYSRFSKTSRWRAPANKLGFPQRAYKKGMSIKY